MAYNNLTSRTDAAALIPEEVSRDLIRRSTEESAVLSLFRRVSVGVAQTRMPVISALPVAYWVNGDTGLKQTTEINWANKYLNIEEIAVILPVPDAVIADVEFNIWDEAVPYITEAIGRTLDAAVFFGTNAPASFPDDVYTSLDAAANDVTEGTVAASGGYYADVDAALAAMEADGYEADAIVAHTSFKGMLRAARASDGQRLDVGRVAGDLGAVDGINITYPMRGLWATASGSPRAIFLQRDQFVVGVRQDISYKIFTEGVINDETGAIVYNLMQQDMSAMRVTFRVGWQVANVINYDQATEALRYPAASLDRA
jgi:HK97 family phage major capsid protein